MIPTSWCKGRKLCLSTVGGPCRQSYDDDVGATDSDDDYDDDCDSDKEGGSG